MIDSEIYVPFGRLVRQHRERLGKSQAALAEAVGLSRASVANIEGGRQHIPLHHLFALALALEVSPTTLLPDISAAQTPSAPVDISAAEDLNERERAAVARVIGSLSS